MSVDCTHDNATHCKPGKSLTEGTGMDQLKSLFLGAAQHFSDYLKTRKQQQIDRDAFNHLLSLDETMLKDIGLRRDDVLWATKLPLSINAALELEKTRLSKQSFNNENSIIRRRR